MSFLGGQSSGSPLDVEILWQFMSYMYVCNDFFRPVKFLSRVIFLCARVVTTWSGLVGAAVDYIVGLVLRHSPLLVYIGGVVFFLPLPSILALEFSKLLASCSGTVPCSVCAPTHVFLFLSLRESSLGCPSRLMSCCMVIVFVYHLRSNVIAFVRFVVHQRARKYRYIVILYSFSDLRWTISSISREC
jgi:hypothetical protein